MTTTIAAYNLLAKDLPGALDRVARQPTVERDIAAYLRAIPNVKSIDDFMGNDRVYRFALKAFGMEDMIYAKAFIRRALREGIDARGSLANSLTDPRFRELVTTFNFARYGATTTTFTRTQEGTVDRFIQQTLETQAGSTNEGVRLALYFKRKAAGATSSYGLLADRALLKVTQVALGLPASTGALPLDRQVALIEKRLPVADLRDPAKVDKLMSRFLALWDIENPTSSAPSQAAGLIVGGSVGIGTDLLAQLQGLRSKV
ncbi:MAG: DUF1217 domain-containing protein [Hyphomicrobiaceae bacterium]